MLDLILQEQQTGKLTGTCSSRSFSSFRGSYRYILIVPIVGVQVVLKPIPMPTPWKHFEPSFLRKYKMCEMILFFFQYLHALLIIAHSIFFLFSFYFYDSPTVQGSQALFTFCTGPCTGFRLPIQINEVLVTA